MKQIAASYADGHLKVSVTHPALASASTVIPATIVGVMRLPRWFATIAEELPPEELDAFLAAASECIDKMLDKACECAQRQFQHGDN